MHSYTNWLLTLLEESELWKGAFGFRKDSSDPVKNGGKKLVEHHQAIATHLLINDPGGSWDKADVIKLGDAVKNRINWCVFLSLCVSPS